MTRPLPHRYRPPDSVKGRRIPPTSSTIRDLEDDRGPDATLPGQRPRGGLHVRAIEVEHLRTHPRPRGRTFGPRRRFVRTPVPTRTLCRRPTPHLGDPVRPVAPRLYGGQPDHHHHAHPAADRRRARRRGRPAGTAGVDVSWVLAFAALVMGPISDRIGRRRVLLLGSGALVVALALHGLANTFESLLVMRVLAGAAAACCPARR